MKHACQLTALVVLASACSGEEEAKPPLVRSIRYVVVAEGSVSGDRVFSGALEAGNESRLSFQVGGRIRTLPVKVGQRVKKGQLVAELDPTDLRVQFREAQANVARARAQAKAGDASYQRIRRMYETQNTSRQELDSARAQRDTAQASLAAALEGLRRAERQLSYTRLEAPAAGVVNGLDAETSEVVSPGRTIATLQAGDALEAAVDVPEAFIRRVGLGDPAKIRIRAVNAEVDGVIQEIGVAAQGSGVFPVRVKLSSEPEAARPGMVSEVTLSPRAEATPAEPGFDVPLTALGEDREGRFVYVVEGQPGTEGTVRRVAVQVGTLSARGARITSGLEVGMLVVTAGVSRIDPGLTVRIPEHPAEVDS